MIQPNQQLLEEPYIKIKVIKGYNLLASRENQEAEENNESICSCLGEKDQTLKENYEIGIINKQSNYKKEGLQNSIIKIRNDQNLNYLYNVSVSIHTPASLLFQTPAFKTYDGQVNFEQNQSIINNLSEYNDIYKECDHSQGENYQNNNKQFHYQRYKNNQPQNNSQKENKIFLKNLSKYIMVDVMDRDCYMENTVISTQVIPTEFFLIPTNAGKKWKFWMKMNKYIDDQTQIDNKTNENKYSTKLHSQSIYYNNSDYYLNENEKSFARVINSTDKQIEQISGINTSNFEKQIVEVSQPKNHNIYSSIKQSFKNDLNEEDDTSIGTKLDFSNNSSKADSPNKIHQHEISEFSDLEDFKQINKNQQYINYTSTNKSDSIMNELDKNYSWLQLEVVLMDIGSLMKIKADIISIQEIERIGKPNVFYYNIIITRNDGLIYLVKRRFKQFFNLKNQLQRNIKKVQNFNFPSRSLSKIYSLFFQKFYAQYSEQALERKPILQNFLDSINELDEVYKEDSFIEFFTSGCQLDPQINKSES